MAYLPAEPNDRGTVTISLPSWADNSWDEATIEGKLIPGLVRVEPKRGVKYDVKEAPGATGAKVTFKGYGAATFKLVVRMWTPEQEAAFDADILPLIEPTPGKDSPKGYSFIHPATAKRKIDGILVEDVEGPKIDNDAQFVEWSIDAFEYRKPQPQHGGPGKPGLTPCQQAKATYDQKVAEYNAALAKYNSGADPTYNYAPVQAAFDSMQYQAQLLDENGCNEASGGSDAAAGNTPDP